MPEARAICIDFWMEVDESRPFIVTSGILRSDAAHSVDEVKQLRIAIIGFGPRGLGALEAVIGIAREPLSVDIFEPSKWPASGPNFSPDELPVCQLNIPVRTVDLTPPANLLDFPSFADWIGAKDGEIFPPRAQLGAYLSERFEAQMRSLPDNIRVTHRREFISGIRRDPQGWHLSAETSHGPFDHVVLSVGQPATTPDEQWQRWSEHAHRHDLILRDAYPARRLISDAEAWAGKTVAIRGLGLSTLDVIRALTLGLGGRFDGETYLPSGREPARIVPFSLDGKPPAPKPANANLDARFDPTRPETEAFHAALQAALKSDANTALQTICEALIAPCLRIARDFGAAMDETALRAWLSCERQDPGAQDKSGTVEALRAGIAEATGSAPPSIGYIVGQLWRKWQEPLRDVYGSSETGAEMAKRLTGFDEGLKRYSYGAPLETARQLLTLINRGIVDPRLAADPDVLLKPEGWVLNEGKDAVTAQVMIDGVIPPPKLSAICDPLIAELRDTGTLKALADDMGAVTKPDATVGSARHPSSDSLSLLGRLANGSVIAFDSVHDCFGSSAMRWARMMAAQVGR